MNADTSNKLGVTSIKEGELFHYLHCLRHVQRMSDNRLTKRISSAKVPGSKSREEDL